MYIKEEKFTRIRGVMAREESPELSRASPQRSRPPPTAVGPEVVKPPEGALVPVPFLLRRQPKPEPRKAAAERRGQKPQLRPAHLGEWRASWEVDGKQVAGPPKAEH